jgi:hypothetical protein
VEAAEAAVSLLVPIEEVRKLLFFSDMEGVAD